MRRLKSRSFTKKQLGRVIGNRIQAFRKERAWSQGFLASVLEIDVDWLRSYESGNNIPPSYTIYQLAGAFGISAGALLDEDPAERPVVSTLLLRLLRRLDAVPTKGQEAVAAFLEPVLGFIEALSGSARGGLWGEMEHRLAQTASSRRAGRREGGGTDKEASSNTGKILKV
jgi:transcriptional regulator with XRE-family HTH domain